MKALLVLAGAAIACLGVGCAATKPVTSTVSPSTTFEVVLLDGSVISGDYSPASLLIPRGATVFVDGDLRIHSSGDVVLEGRLIAVDAQAGGASPDAPDIEIITAGWLFIGGEVTGGSGASFADEDGQNFGEVGGDGSGIRIDCSTYTLLAPVRAGQGGAGGAGAQGGNGGNLEFRGNPDGREVEWAPISAVEPAFYGGGGGKGGKGYRSAGGAGGHAGYAIHRSSDAGDE